MESTVLCTRVENVGLVMSSSWVVVVCNGSMGAGPPADVSFARSSSVVVEGRADRARCSSSVVLEGRIRPNNDCRGLGGWVIVSHSGT